MQALVFVDVTDAWSYIGSVRFERAAALFTILSGEPVEIGYRAALVSGAPPAIEVAPAARISGIDLNVDEIIPADTTDAWRLLSWALETGQEHQRELLHQLWRAHFLEGVDVAEPFVLASRAVLAGLRLEDAEALLASDEYADRVEIQRDTARDLGVRITPFVVVDQRHTLQGVHSQNDYLQALQSIRGGG